jgi:hypothetical protein
LTLPPRNSLARDDVPEPARSNENGAEDSHQPVVGQGLTFRLGIQVYPATIVEVSEDGERITFHQDAPVRRKGVHFGPAYVFRRGTGMQRFEARRQGDGYVFTWTGEPVELGVRRCYTTPVLRPEEYPNLELTPKDE